MLYKTSTFVLSLWAEQHCFEIDLAKEKKNKKNVGNMMSLNSKIYLTKWVELLTKPNFGGKGIKSNF